MKFSRSCPIYTLQTVYTITNSSQLPSIQIQVQTFFSLLEKHAPATISFTDSNKWFLLRPFFSSSRKLNSYSRLLLMPPSLPTFYFSLSWKHTKRMKMKKKKKLSKYLKKKRDRQRNGGEKLVEWKMYSCKTIMKIINFGLTEIENDGCTREPLRRAVIHYKKCTYRIIRSNEFPIFMTSNFPHMGVGSQFLVIATEHE